MRARNFILETAQEEAWELVLQPVPEIQAFVKQMGLGNDEKSVAQIASRINAIPDQRLPAASIPRLKNLANKPGEGAILQALQRISGRPDAAEQYIQLMQKRDSAEGRQRDHVSGLVDQIRSGQYESPVLLKLPTGLYVIGGRTRLYAALALGVPANVKIIGGDTFSAKPLSRTQESITEQPGSHSPRELQTKVIDRELKRRGVEYDLG